MIKCAKLCNSLRAVVKSRQAWFVVLMASVVAVYTFYCSAGLLKSFPMYMNYYDLLADGFRSGHLYTSVEPSPALLAKRNPYDAANYRLWLHDGSFYNGKYYLYWGPTPALLLALVKSVFSINRPVGDAVLSFVAFTVAAAFGALIIDRAGRRLFGSVPRWIRGLAILAFALANPVLHIVASAGVYVAAIGAAQAFFFGGLLFAFDAVWAAPSSGANWRWSVAGTLWALAIASRATMLPVSGLCAVLCVLAAAWPTQRRLRNGIRIGLMLCTPMVLGILSLLLYNKLRFDDWFEVGIKHMTTTLPFQVSPRYVWANIYSYSLRPFIADCQFPFLIASPFMGKLAFPSGFNVPSGYLLIEPLVGWMRAVPLTWLIPGLPFALVPRLRILRAQSQWALSYPSIAADAKARTFVWLVACALVLATVSAVPSLGLYMGTMRYLADFTGGLLLLAILSGFALYSGTAGTRVRWASGALFAALSVGTIVISMLLGYQGYAGHFKRFNPALDAKIVNALSMCQSDR